MDKNAFISYVQNAQRQPFLSLKTEKREYVERLYRQKLSRDTVGMSENGYSSFS